MLGKQLLWSLSLLVIIGATKADGNNADCIDGTPVENFNASAASGWWYTNRKTDEDGDTEDKSCLMAYLEDNEEENKLIGIRLWVDKSDNSSHYLENDNGRWDQDGQGNTLNGYPGTIVGTDYNSWLIMLTCDESTNKRVVFGLTRGLTLGIGAIYSADSVLRQYGMGLTDLSQLDQSGCPEDWDDAEEAK